MNKKVVAGSLAVLLLAGGGYGGYHVYANYQAKQEVQQQVDTIASLQEKVNALYADKTKEFLAEDVTQEKIDKINKELEKHEGKEFTQENAGKLNTVIMDLGYVKSMVELKNLASSLLNTEGVLAEDADIETASTKAEELKVFKEKFVLEQQKNIDEAKKQQEEIKDATEKVNQFFTSEEHNEVKSDVTRSSYDEVKELIDKIKQGKAKEALAGAIKKVDTYLAEKEAAQKAEQERIAKEQAKQESQSNTSDSSNSSTQNNSSSSNNSNSSKENSNSSSNSSSSSSKGNNNSSSSSSSSSSKGNNNSSSSGNSSSSKGNDNSSSSSSSSSGGSGGSSSSNGSNGNSSNSGGSWTDSLKPGDSWDVDWNDSGSITGGENGNTWESGTVIDK